MENLGDFIIQHNIKNIRNIVINYEENFINKSITFEVKNEITEKVNEIVSTMNKTIDKIDTLTDTINETTDKVNENNKVICQKIAKLNSRIFRNEHINEKKLDAIKSEIKQIDIEHKLLNEPKIILAPKEKIKLSDLFDILQGGIIAGCVEILENEQFGNFKMLKNICNEKGVIKCVYTNVIDVTTLPENGTELYNYLNENKERLEMRSDPQNWYKLQTFNRPRYAKYSGKKCIYVKINTKDYIVSKYMHHDKKIISMVPKKDNLNLQKIAERLKIKAASVADLNNFEI